MRVRSTFPFLIFHVRHFPSHGWLISSVGKAVEKLFQARHHQNLASVNIRRRVQGCLESPPKTYILSSRSDSRISDKYLPEEDHILVGFWPSGVIGARFLNQSLPPVGIRTMSQGGNFK